MCLLAVKSVGCINFMLDIFNIEKNIWDNGIIIGMGYRRRVVEQYGSPEKRFIGEICTEFKICLIACNYQP